MNKLERIKEEYPTLYKRIVELANCKIHNGDQVKYLFEWLSTTEAVGWAQDAERIHVAKGRIYTNDLPGVHNGTIRICYIYRDIRDVAASMKERWGDSGDALLAKLDQEVTTYGVAHETASVLVQRYEDVISDTAAAVREIGDYLGLKPVDDTVAAIVDECSLDELEQVSSSRALRFSSAVALGLIRFKRKLPPPLNRKCGLRKRVFKIAPKQDERTLIGSRHISSTRGASGQWRLELDEAEQAAIESRYEQWLVTAGYETAGFAGEAPSDGR